MSTGIRWRRATSARFRFGQAALDLASGRLDLHYALDDIALTETFELPPREAERPLPMAALAAAVDLLHWVAGISYWKAACPDTLEFEGLGPDHWQSDWLNRLYRQGLAEFAYRNALDPEAWPLFQQPAAARPKAGTMGLARRSLVPMGGGKDSLVAWARLSRLGESASSVQVGSAELIRQLAGHLGSRHLVVRRRLDPALGRLNQQGAWNGHVPVTAINAAALIVLALWDDYDRVVFANERSADQASLIDAAGRPVNHQFSKSLVFERMLDEWVRRYIATDLRVFSLLRRDRELAVCREFSALSQYHGLFSSCNRNFHLDGPRGGRWCGQCPKCHFVFLALAPFMSPSALADIVGRDLLADPEQLPGFLALLGLDGVKPFECVGEAEEAQAAAAALAADPRWCGHIVVQGLAESLAARVVPTLADLCEPGGPHLIPDEWLDAPG